MIFDFKPCPVLVSKQAVLTNEHIKLIDTDNRVGWLPERKGVRGRVKRGYKGDQTYGDVGRLDFGWQAHNAIYG